MGERSGERASTRAIQEELKSEELLVHGEVVDRLEAASPALNREQGTLPGLLSHYFPSTWVEVV
jgi:hypothetical protein